MKLNIRAKLREIWSAIRQIKPHHIFYTGVHTEYAGEGRVRFFSFFRGAGYCIYFLRGKGGDGRPLDEPGWRPTLCLRGFTVYFRTHGSSIRTTWGKPVKRFRITRNPNQAII